MYFRWCLSASLKEISTWVCHWYGAEACARVTYCKRSSRLNILKKNIPCTQKVNVKRDGLLWEFRPHLISTKARNLSNFNRENFRTDISRQDWSCTSDDPNVLWADWKAKFLSIVNSHASIKTKRVRSGKVPWITSDLRKGMRDRDVAKRKAIKGTVSRYCACTKLWFLDRISRNQKMRGE